MKYSKNNYDFILKPQFQRDISNLPKETRERIKKKLAEFKKQLNEYSLDPRVHNSTKFITSEKIWRLRIGDYRAFFDISEDTLFFRSVIHRKDAYA